MDSRWETVRGQGDAEEAALLHIGDTMLEKLGVTALEDAVISTAVKGLAGEDQMVY